MLWRRGAWSGSGDVDQAHVDLRWKLRAALESCKPEAHQKRSQARMEPAAKRPRAMPGPCIWWVRNDLRLEDNPVVRAIVGPALGDPRELAAVFVFDPRLLDRSVYGRATDCYSAMNKRLGWADAWTSHEQHDWATPVRPMLPAPAAWPPPPENLQLPGLVPAHILADEAKLMKHLGYTAEETRQAQAQDLPAGPSCWTLGLMRPWALGSMF